MTLRIEVRFDCAVNETVFLESGWGIRDVRGPYLIKEKGIVAIPDWLLDENFTTSVSMVFSLSNRSLREAVEIYVSYEESVFNETVIKNGSIEICIPDIKRAERPIKIAIAATGLVSCCDGFRILPVIDFLTLDGLTMERNVNPTRYYVGQTFE